MPVIKPRPLSWRPHELVGTLLGLADAHDERIEGSFVESLAQALHLSQAALGLLDPQPPRRGRASRCTDEIVAEIVQCGEPTRFASWHPRLFLDHLRSRAPRSRAKGRIQPEEPTPASPESAPQAVFRLRAARAVLGGIQPSPRAQIGPRATTSLDEACFASRPAGSRSRYSLLPCTISVLMYDASLFPVRLPFRGNPASLTREEREPCANSAF